MKTAAFALVLLLVGYASSPAQLIGVQFYETAYPTDNKALTSSQVAGVIPQDNFNIVGTTSSSSSGSLASLKTSTGATSGVTFSFSGNTDDYYSGTGSSTPNDTLLSAMGGLYRSPSATYQFSGLAAGVYDLVVYTLTDSAGVPAELQLTTGTTSGPTAYYDLEQNAPDFNGTFIQGSATTQATATTANYIEFANVSPVGGVLKLTFPNLNSLSFGGGIGINAFQLEEVPEPSTLGLMAGSAALLLAFWYRRLLVLL
jgi:hypothetical protein